MSTLDHIPSDASTEEEIAMHLAQLARRSLEWGGMKQAANPLLGWLKIAASVFIL